MSNSKNNMKEIPLEELREKLNRDLVKYYNLMNSKSTQLQREESVRKLKALFNTITKRRIHHD